MLGRFFDFFIIISFNSLNGAINTHVERYFGKLRYGFNSLNGAINTLKYILL